MSTKQWTVRGHRVFRPNDTIGVVVQVKGDFPQTDAYEVALAGQKYGLGYVVKMHPRLVGTGELPCLVGVPVRAGAGDSSTAYEGWTLERLQAAVNDAVELGLVKRVEGEMCFGPHQVYDPIHIGPSHREGYAEACAIAEKIGNMLNAGEE